jgi:hypothetical protein
MSYGNPQPCKNNCGAWIYFDKDSAAGHPSADKWLPLEYNHDTGIKTGLIHQCSNKRSNVPKFQQSLNLATSSTQETKEADTSNTNALLKIIIAELQRLINLFEEQQRKEDNVSNDRNLLDNR